MFGRKDEDYEAYNEKYASRYDDDYIAPSEEYRSKCYHSHGQSYENINDVRECDHSHEQSYENINEVHDCDHSHEQTYEDADYEQRTYDDYATLESRFQPYIAPGEHLLWAGGFDKLSPKPPEERKKDKKNLILWLSLGMILIILGAVICITFIIGIIFIFIGIASSTGAFNSGVHAITDRRLMTLKGTAFSSVPLEDIYNITHVRDNRGYGYLSYSTKRPAYMRQSSVNGEYRGVIQGIKDPERVHRILDDAVHGALINNKKK